MKKTCLKLIIIIGIICLTVTGCFVENDPDDVGSITAGPAWGDGTYSGSVDGSSKLGYGGAMYPITVVLDIELGRIKTIDVTHKETAAIGGVFINKVKPLIVKANSFEIDAISKATCTNTKNGLLEAGKTALNKIPLVDIQ